MNTNENPFEPDPTWEQFAKQGWMSTAEFEKRGYIIGVDWSAEYLKEREEDAAFLRSCNIKPE